MPASTMSEHRVAGRYANTPGRGRHLVRGASMANDTCSIDGCERAHKARGWCAHHYNNWRNNGDPERTLRERRVFRYEDARCGMDGCDGEVHAREMCGPHYRRAIGTVDPDAPVRIVGDDDARFDQYVDRDGPNGCHLWTGWRDDAGYGYFRVGDRHVAAYRFAYEREHGPIPEDKEMDHFVCSNPPCCNPDHVRPVSRWENTLRGDSPAAWQKAQTHCKRGHEFTDENTYLWRGERHCRTCQRLRREGQL